MEYLERNIYNNTFYNKLMGVQILLKSQLSMKNQYKKKSMMEIKMYKIIKQNVRTRVFNAFSVISGNFRVAVNNIFSYIMLKHEGL